MAAIASTAHEHQQKEAEDSAQKTRFGPSFGNRPSGFGGGGFFPFGGPEFGGGMNFGGMQQPGFFGGSGGGFGSPYGFQPSYFGSGAGGYPGFGGGFGGGFGNMPFGGMGFRSGNMKR